MEEESPKNKAFRVNNRNINVNIVSSQEYVSPKRADDAADGSKVVSKRNSQTNAVMSDFINTDAVIQSKKYHPSTKLMPTNARKSNALTPAPGTFSGIESQDQNAYGDSPNPNDSHMQMLSRGDGVQ